MAALGQVIVKSKVEGTVKRTVQPCIITSPAYKVKVSHYWKQITRVVQITMQKTRN